MRVRALLLLSALPLLAGDETAVGIVAGADQALGSLKDDGTLGTRRSLGVHGGVQFAGSINDRNDLRVQLVWAHFGGSPWEGSGQRNSYEDRQLGVDWIHGFSVWEERVYLLAGANLNNFHVRYEGPLSPAETRFQKAALGARAGLGYAFSRHFQIEGHVDEVWTKRGGAEGLGLRPVAWARLSAIIQF